MRFLYFLIPPAAAALAVMGAILLATRCGELLTVPVGLGCVGFGVLVLLLVARWGR